MKLWLNSTIRTPFSRRLQGFFLATDFSTCSQNHDLLGMKTKTKPHPTSKEIRKLFIEYFAQKKQHTYVPSSPVFLDNDPSLLFVNAGMNQFKPKLLNKISPNHDFYNLKNAVNSQKCVRISGKHNDLDDVGLDFHHHTFFEMLGNWSFGDYFKKEACAMSWEVLTKMYGLPKDKLYVTYFGGDKALGLPPDLETRDIWHDVGVPDGHILSFGVKENFWDMGDTGPCGPCSEIHFSYLDDGCKSGASALVNAGSPDVIEVWNLVFMQYNRRADGTLTILPCHNVDTGMGLERLTAILQGTKSNYDTDLFVPIFQAMQKNFNLKPYEGSQSEMDIAYRIIADHARMITVAVSDGLLSESFGAGHILRKIIRRSSFMANKFMKTRPGVLSAIVPYVAETLDFFPEIAKHVKEVETVVNEEEKQFHQIINRGRKIRNKMMTETKEDILQGKHVWDLCNNFGLEANVVEDLAAEVNFKLDWEGYHQICQQNKLKACSLKSQLDIKLPSNIIEHLHANGILCTDDSYKYGLNPDPLSANLLAMVVDEGVTKSAEVGEKLFLITDKSNFYSNAGGQVSDMGTMSTEDAVFAVENVHTLSGYVFHEGRIINGRLNPNDKILLSVDKDRRQKCSRNHTATHLLSASLRKLFPHTSQRSSHVDSTHLRFGFSCKVPLTVEHVVEIEDFVNQAIKENHTVASLHMKLEDAQGMPNVSFLRGEVYPENITLIQIAGDQNMRKSISTEPCCGTHVRNTSDIKKFVITESKSQSGSVRILSAATGDAAERIMQKGDAMVQKLNCIKMQVEQLKAKIGEEVEFGPLLKEVKKLLHECNVANDLPLRVRQNCESTLIALKLMLTNLVSPGQDNNKTYGDRCVKDDVEKKHIPDEVHSFMQRSDIPNTDDSYKYKYISKDGARVVSPLRAKIKAAFQNTAPVQSIERGQHCILVTDHTNFYSEGDGQSGDIGDIYNNEFQMKVAGTYCKDGYVYHIGWIKSGTLQLDSQVTLEVDECHRENCSFHHTACHLLHTVLKNVSPFAYIQSSFASVDCLRLQVKLQKALSIDEIKTVEETMNAAISDCLKVSRTVIPQSSLKELPNVYFPPGEVCPDPVTLITIGNEALGQVISMEPCRGTHAENTSELQQFIIVTSKTGKNMEKILRAVSGNAAKEVSENGAAYERNMLELQERVLTSIDCSQKNFLELWDLLHEVKASKNLHENELPFLLFRKHQDTLSTLTKSLTNATKGFVQQAFSQLKTEMEDVLARNVNNKYVIHRINACGDGKKLSNAALASVPDRPAFFFAQDGRRTVICSCSVPKSQVTASLSALLWLEPVAAHLKGKARFQTKDPDLYYSVESDDIDNLNEAMVIARKYIDSCL